MIVGEMGNNSKKYSSMLIKHCILGRFESICVVVRWCDKLQNILCDRVGCFFFERLTYTGSCLRQIRLDSDPYQLFRVDFARGYS